MPRLAKSAVEKMTLRELTRLKSRLENERAIHVINGESVSVTNRDLRVVDNELEVRKQSDE